MENETIRYDERRKVLIRFQADTVPLCGDKKYGEVKRTFDYNIPEEGIKKIVQQMNGDLMSFKAETTKQEGIAAGAQKIIEFNTESIKKINKEIDLVKKAVGSRINWKDQKDAQNGSKKPIEKPSKEPVKNVEEKNQK